jgi:signal transduction histidine kinase
VEYLESDRFPDERASLALRDYIRQKYRERRIDLVITITDVACHFALRHRTDLFPDAPMVFSAVAPPDERTRLSGPGLTGILYGAGFGDTLQLALRLHPSTRRVFYVAEAPDAALREAMRAEVRAVAQDVELIGINEAALPRLIAAVRAVPRDSIILYIRHSRDQAGNVLFPSEIAPLVAQAASVPVYGVAESYLGSGIVGGVMHSRRLIGTRLGEMAAEILRGTRPQDIPIEHASRVPMLDWRQMRRWGIAESSLPAGSIVLSREISTWERHKTLILVASGVLVLQSLLIAGLVFERRRRRRAEMNARRHLAGMAHLDRRAAMGELATSLAHELNQPLNAILQNAGVAQMLLTSSTLPPALGEMAEIISDIRKDDLRASEVIRRMRALLQKHELEAQRVDLNDVARDTVAIVWPEAKARQIQLEVELAEGVRPILGDRVHLQQVLLNLLMNAADAVTPMPPERRRVRVWTRARDGEVRLGVDDTGVGIPTDRLSQVFEPFYTTKRDGSGMGMGLAIARSIVEAHAGRMGAENIAGGGATVWVSLPVSAAARS